MSVLIKGMEMPTSCYACDMLELSGVVGCNHAYDTKNSEWGRALDCPLVPVPPHGRLIDADELFKEMERKGWFDNADRDKAEDLVLAASTIIPASGKDTDVPTREEGET